ncbi:hypothetical protein Plhal703r1_c71g0171301 [Plasmopara halstedii]
MHLRMIAMQRCIDCPIYMVRPGKFGTRQMKKDKAVIVGFGISLVGIASVLGIYLPRYSTMARQGRERTLRNRGLAENSATERMVEKPSSSMFDKRRRE